MKYWVLLFCTVFLFVLFFFAIVPLIDFLLNNLKPASVLKDALDAAKFIPDNFSIQDALLPLFIPAWAINDRTPRFFSQYS